VDHGVVGVVVQRIVGGHHPAVALNISKKLITTFSKIKL
jgi:hypothetical protein